MTVALSEVRGVGLGHQGPGTEGLLGPAGNALWKQLYSLRYEVACCIDDCPPGEGIALEGLWTDRASFMQGLGA